MKEKNNAGPPFMIHRFQLNHKEQEIKPPGRSGNFVTLFILA